MVEPPYWLTNKGVDEIDAEECDMLRTELMTIPKAEETIIYSSAVSADVGKTMPPLSEVMEQAWATGTFWYAQALSSPTGLFRLFYDRILPLLSEHTSEEIGEVMPFFWGKDVGTFVAGKISDKKKYDHELQLAFEESGSKREISTGET